MSGSLLHADSLRSMCGKCMRHCLEPTDYMKPRETWGRMAAKILSGDFLQLPPVPASSSLAASLLLCASKNSVISSFKLISISKSSIHSLDNCSRTERILRTNAGGSMESSYSCIFCFNEVARRLSVVK